MDLSTTSHRWRFAEHPRERLLAGLALSLLVHGFILSLEFGIPGLGLPGLSAPWNERRAHTVDISVVLAPSPAPAAAPAPPPPPAAPEPIATPATSVPSPAATPPQGFRLVPPRAAAPMPAPAKAKPTPSRKPKPKPAQVKSQQKLIAQAESRNDKFVVAPPDPDIPAATSTSKIETENPPEQIAEAAAPETAPIKPEEPAPAVDDRQDQKRAEEEAALQAKEAETKKQEEAQRLAREQEAQRKAEEAARAAARQQEAALAAQREQEAAKKRKEEAAARKALELEQQRLAELKKQADEKAALEKAAQEKAAQEKAAREAAELAARQRAEEDARRRTAELERKRQADELARQKEAEELARKKQAEELAAKAKEQELARQRAEAAAMATAERQRELEETGRAAAAARQAGNDNHQGGASSLSRDLYGGSGLASRALEQARRPDPLRAEPQAPTGNAPERSQRRSVFGSLDRDVGLAMYIKSWALKIERNGSLNYSQLSKDRARGDPVVTVAIRSDGSVEDVIINRTSGRPDLDEAVRRIVRLNARYAVFPPDLARKYDVIEIRRIWSFDDTLRLVEEVR